MNYDYNSGNIPLTRTAKKCATCRYWEGTIRVRNRLCIEFSKYEKATCDLTGFEKSGLHSCPDHEFKVKL